jgi:hypothetical protein
MNRHLRISNALKTAFNAEDGLSLEASTRLYLQLITRSPSFEGFKAELEEAFADPRTPWKALLLNEQYEVYDATNEAEARDYAYRVLWLPIEHLA